MLLKKLDIVNATGSTLTLPLEKSSSGLFVKDVTGLGPAKATMISSSFASMDGAQYHSSKREPRNIVVKLGLDPDYALYSVHDLRAELYQFLMPKSGVKLQIQMYDHRINSFIDQFLNVEIDAYVESFEVDMFTKDPTVDLSLMCYEPEFIHPDTSIFEGVTVDGLTESVYTYAGSVETGFVFTIFVDRTLDEFTIYHRPPNQKLYSAYFSAELLAGDELKISSVKGDKYVHRIRGGVESTQLFALTPQSNWLELQPGDNYFRVYATGAAVPYQIKHQTKYGGL